MKPKEISTMPPMKLRLKQYVNHFAIRYSENNIIKRIQKKIKNKTQTYIKSP